MAEYEALIFDLDGTLLNTSDGIFHTANVTAKELGLSEVHDRALFEKHFIGPPLHHGFKMVYGLEGEMLEKAVNAYIRNYRTCGGAEMYSYYPGLVEVVKRLKAHGYRIGVSTLKNEQVASRMLRNSEYGDVFDIIHGSDNTETLTKSDIIEMSLGDLGFPKEKVLMIGDSESDQNGAHVVGMPFLAVSWGFGFHFGFGCEKVVHTTGQLLEYLF